MEIYEGNMVRAFHPAMFGVIVYGTVVKVGSRTGDSQVITVDFGPIHGGIFRIHKRDIVACGKALT